MTWSLHPFYKRRLSSVFALRRVSVAAASERSDGHSDLGGVPLRAPRAGRRRRRDRGRTRLRQAGADLGDRAEAESGRDWPTLIVCAAANISDPGATPPGRSVTSFTFSPHAIGGPLVGAVPMELLERAFDRPGKKAGRRRRDLTLPAAMAMSGAAISPSMGTKTRRPLTFLMALANIRLGVWVPNPRWARRFERDRGLRERHDRPRPVYLLCELLGLNRIGNKYLYITDGGHYENLGLVELLRRGCTEIYCLDASGVGQDGADFEALGEAIALARSELAVEIEFDAGEKANPTSLQADDEGFANTTP